MKIQFNTTTCDEDLERYPTTENFLEYASRFDGIELMYYGEDVNGIYPKDKVVGYHMMSYLAWYDLWQGDLEAVEREFLSLEEAEKHYGGLDREAILRPLRADLEHARFYEPEYLVYHVEETGLYDSFTFEYSKTDEQVIDATCELMNTLFADMEPGPALLLENLWEPGINLRRPEMVARLMDGIEYPNKGVMLDTGHLIHTNFDLETQEQALEFVNSKIDALEELGLTKYIRGMHLQQSLTGDICKANIANPPDWTGKTYSERRWDAFMNAFAIDKHQPFTCKGVDEMINRLPLEYLTFEFITSTREQHQGYIDAQWAALPNLKR